MVVVVLVAVGVLHGPGWLAGSAGWLGWLGWLARLARLAGPLPLQSSADLEHFLKAFLQSYL